MPYKDPWLQSKAQRRHWEKNKESYVQGVRDRRKRNRNYIQYMKLETGCTHCGYNEHPAALDFDHLDPTTKNYTLARMANRGFSLKKIDEEIAKCQVLCANCHRIKTYELLQN